MKSSERVGLVYNRLKFIEVSATKPKGLFLCSCGTLKEIHMSHVFNGRVKSCGCLHIEVCKSGINQTKHGDAKLGAVTRLHNIWRGMHKRCSLTCSKPHPDYALRGITVCEDWQDFVVFKEWAASAGYEDTLSIERLNVNGNYEPSNCSWAVAKDQARNRRSSAFITAYGKTQTLAQWSEELDIPYARIQARLNKLGWAPERALVA